MKNIDVKGLPEPVAQAIATMVQTLRNQLREEKERPQEKVTLPIKEGNVIGSLRRQDIYDDAL